VLHQGPCLVQHVSAAEGIMELTAPEIYGRARVQYTSPLTGLALAESRQGSPGSILLSALIRNGCPSSILLLLSRSAQLWHIPSSNCIQNHLSLHRKHVSSLWRSIELRKSWSIAQCSSWINCGGGGVWGSVVRVNCRPRSRTQGLRAGRRRAGEYRRRP
jgi:hypothetical protein